MSKKLLLPFLLFHLLITLITPITNQKEELDISNYPYPTRDNNANPDIYKIAIFGTNDLHGKIFPQEYNKPNSEERYESGGAEYIYSYAKILREEWGEQFIWLDAGDQFTGGLEFTFDDGEVMTTYYNAVNITAMALGNHDFDKGPESLKKFMSNAKFDYLCANLQEKATSKKPKFPHLNETKVYKVGEVKVGVIGLITTLTPGMSSTDLTDYNFLDYLEIVNRESERLRKDEKVNAVILLAHLGPKCEYNDEKFKLNTRKKGSPGTAESECEEDQEFNKLLSKLKPGTVDAVVSGHVHDVMHHWINGVPTIETNGMFYSNVIYLSFNKSNNYKIISEDSEIEGPMPACGQIFEKTLRCEYSSDLSKTGDLTKFKFHNVTIEKDPDLAKELEYFYDKLAPKRKRVATTKVELVTSGQRDAPLSNLVTDMARIVTGADVALYNLGGIRSTWMPGYITEVDIFNMFPFDNNFTSLIMTGAELTKMLFEVQGGSNINPSSGLMQLFSDNGGNKKLVEVKLFDGVNIKNIEKEKNYIIAMNDFLANGGGFFRRILKWYTPKGYKYYGNERDDVTRILRGMNVITEDMVLDPLHPRIRIVKNKFYYLKRKLNNEDDNKKKFNDLYYYELQDFNLI